MTATPFDIEPVVRPRARNQYTPGPIWINVQMAILRRMYGGGATFDAIGRELVAPGRSRRGAPPRLKPQVQPLPTSRRCRAARLSWTTACPVGAGR
jgi:hypothetical protein